MAKTYLELSESGEGAHKFYEVEIKGSTVNVRFGRIGVSGTTQAKRYGSPAEAKQQAEKQIAKKLKKGYEHATMGERKKRPVTRRATASRGAAAGTKKAPVLWKFKAGSQSALGIFVDDELCWIGNMGGKVFALDHDANVVRSYELPDGVKAIVCDERWIYAGSDDGNVYDLSRSRPTLAYEVSPDIDIFWIDIWSGTLCVSDRDGVCTVFDHEGEQKWRKDSKGWGGWMVRADKDGVYHGTSAGVTKYDWRSGKKGWHKASKGAILFGWQEKTQVFAGTTNDLVQSWTKKGKPTQNYKCDDTIYSNAAAADGKYVFAGDSSSSVYCFAKNGNRLWKLATGCGSALSMQYHREKLYIVTTSGVLACIDASEEAIEAARQGKVPKTRNVAAPSSRGRRVGDALETAAASAEGVVVRCITEKGKVRVRPVSPGFKKTWNVQFPRNLRQDGAVFLVEDLVEATRGGFYRAVGEINRTSEAALSTKKKKTKKKATKKKATKKKATKKKATKKKATKKKATKKKATKKKATKKKATKKKATKKKATKKKATKKKATKKKATKKKATKKKATKKKATKKKATKKKATKKRR